MFTSQHDKRRAFDRAFSEHREITEQTDELAEVRPATYLFADRIVLDAEAFAELSADIESSDPPSAALRGLFDPAERAREKAASRAEDQRAIAAGEKSPDRVRRENASFAFTGARIRFPARDR